jgi:hypothetical protein
MRTPHFVPYLVGLWCSQSEVESTIERIKKLSGVEGYLICNRQGHILRRHHESMSQEVSEKYADMMMSLALQARGVVRDLDPKVCSFKVFKYVSCIYLNSIAITKFRCRSSIYCVEWVTLPTIENKKAWSPRCFRWANAICVVSSVVKYMQINMYAGFPWKSTNTFSYLISLLCRHTIYRNRDAKMGGQFELDDLKFDANIREFRAKEYSNMRYIYYCNLVTYVGHLWRRFDSLNVHKVIMVTTFGASSIYWTSKINAS